MRSLTFTPKAYATEVSGPIFPPFRKSANGRVDVTTANILFSLLDFDRFEEADIYYRLFGTPVTESLKS